MQSGAASLWVRAFRLTLLGVALLCAGCNLGFIGQEASPSFDGPPEVRIVAPAPNQTYLAGAKVIVQARVENAGPDLARISVLLDEALLGEKLNPNETNAAVLPLTIDWTASEAGEFKISVLAERGDGAFDREDVSIAVLSQAALESGETADSAGPEVAQPAVAEPIAQSAESASAPFRADASGVAGRMTQPARIRVGPGAAHDLLGNLDENLEVLIVAVNPSREWYRIEYDDPIDAWVYAEFVRVEGDIAGLPVETGPPLPAAQGVNLLLLDVQVEPPVVCNQESTVRARIRNDGSDETQNVAWVIAEALLLSDGSALSENPPLAYLETLRAGEEDMVEMPITWTGGAGEGQFIRVVVDSGSHLPETDEMDNAGSSASFVLERGGCG